MGRQSQSAAWSVAIIMGLKVILGGLLACSVSSVPLDAGYGVPAAPLLHPPLSRPPPLPAGPCCPAPLPRSSQSCPTYLSLGPRASNPPSTCTSSHPSPVQPVPCPGRVWTV